MIILQPPPRYFNWVP